MIFQLQLTPCATHRIHKYASCSNECFILALIYIDRLIQRNNFLLTDLNVHRVVITAILLAAKFFDDAYYNNAYYAKVGGVLVSEMNGLEVDFLFRINFSLHVTPELFHKYREELVSHSCGALSDNQPEALSSFSIQTVGGHVTRPSMPRAGTGMPTQDTEIVVPPQTQIGLPHSGKRQPSYITPSPPDTSAKNATLHLNGSEIMACPPPGLETAQPSAEVYLHHPKQLQMPTFPMTQPPRRCSPQATYPAPAMVPLVSDGPVVASGSRDEQYLVIDNMAYPIHHPSLVTPTMQLDVNVNASVQQHPLAYPTHQSTDATYPGPHQYFVGGQILTGCTTGI